MHPADEGELARTPPLRELVYERLRDRIVDGSVAPGEHLVETELATSLGVSRGPIREALQLLARDGWVDLRPRQGAFVHRPDPEEVDGFFSVRTLIEVEAARLAAAHAGQGATGGAEDGPDHLSVLLERAHRALERGDDSTLVQANSQFHALVARLSGNDALRQVYDFISRRVRWYFAPLVRPRAMEAWGEHADIAKAIQAGDADAAGELVATHIEHTRRAYRELTS